MKDLRFEPGIQFSDANIEAIESVCRRKLPDAYCQFVKRYGGAFVGGSVDGLEDFPILAFFGPNEDSGVLGKLCSYTDLRDDGVLPFADCELGNLYVLDRTDSIQYLNYYGGQIEVRKIANSFQEFIDRIVVAPE
jgi:hypothetical protein